MKPETKFSSSPVVSIIIPTYRRWELLCNAIESVFEQTYDDWEIVVVNDAGGPPRGRVAEILNDPRITYVEHESNRGLASARNTGILRSSGIYLAYLDDDDIFYPDHLQILVDALEENGWDVAYSDAYEGSYNVIDGECQLVQRRLIFGGPFPVKRLWQANTVPVLSVMHRRECLERTGYFDQSLPVLEDWDMWLRLSCHFSFHHVPAITAEYRVWEDRANMSRNTTNDKWHKTQYLIYRKYLGSPEIMTDDHIAGLLRRAVSRFIRKNCVWFASNLGKPDSDPFYSEMLRMMMIRDWIKMFLNKPRLAAAMGATFIFNHGK